MSKIVEKTVNSLQAYVGKNILGSNYHVQQLLLEISSAPSIEDEDELVAKRLLALQEDMKEYTKSGRMEECLVQAMYFEMLGHPTPFAYIHAVKLLQQGNLKQKIVGYLAACVFLDPDHELVLLLINSIQRDLCSDSSLVVVVALESIPKLIYGELANSVQSLVLQKTRHHSSAVRKAAMTALQHCYSQCGSSQVSTAYFPVLERGLADMDINVVASASACLRHCSGDNFTAMGHLGEPLLEMLAQLRRKTVHSDYEYGGISMPWLQVSILRTLRHINLDAELEGHAAQLLREILDSTVVNQTIYFAIIWECLNTVTSIIDGDSTLTKSSIDCITKMLRSNNTDLNYSGVDALERMLSKCCPAEAVTCQEVIIDCLHHPDESVKMKTLNLLVTMANRKNVSVIVNRILKYISASADSSIHTFVSGKVLHLLRLYPEDVEWAAATFTSLLFLVPHTVSQDDVLYFINMFSRATESVVQHILPQVLSPDNTSTETSPSIVLFRAWVLGEVRPGIAICSIIEAQQGLLTLLQNHYRNRQLALDILSSLSKLALQSMEPLKDNGELLAYLISSAPSLLVRQRARELLNLSGTFLASVERTILRTPMIAPEVDVTLSFLDAYTCKALENGAAPYKPRPFYDSSFEGLTSCQSQHTGTRTPSSVHSASVADIWSPEYFSFNSEAASEESPVKLKPWSAQGRRKDTAVKECTANSEKESENPTKEDEELMKSLFTTATFATASLENVNSAGIHQGQDMKASSPTGLEQQLLPRISERKEFGEIDTLKDS